MWLYHATLSWDLPLPLTQSVKGNLESPHNKVNMAQDKFYGINKNKSNLVPTIFIEGNNVVSFRGCYSYRMVLNVANCGGVDEKFAP